VPRCSMIPVNMNTENSTPSVKLDRSTEDSQK
jgi:hypothetical protein